jgi:hypothetical protein
MPASEALLTEVNIFALVMAQKKRMMLPAMVSRTLAKA